MELYFNEEKNMVFMNGALHPINPDTELPWADKAEALAFIDAFPVENTVHIPEAVITEITGENTIHKDNTLFVDENVPFTITSEMQVGGQVYASLNDIFTVPIATENNAGFKVVKLIFVNGIGTITTSLPTGEYFINEEQLNRRLSRENRIAFPTQLNFVVTEV